MTTSDENVYQLQKKKKKLKKKRFSTTLIGFAILVKQITFPC